MGEDALVKEFKLCISKYDECLKEAQADYGKLIKEVRAEYDESARMMHADYKAILKQFSIRWSQDLLKMRIVCIVFAIIATVAVLY